MWACAAGGCVAGRRSAQNKELSDKSVLTLMQYAWGLVPREVHQPDGKTIEVDKTKPSEVVVPLDDGARGDQGGPPVGLCAGLRA